MARKRARLPELIQDPFQERARVFTRAALPLLGGRFVFESNNRQLLRLVDIAYAGLPPQRVAAASADMRVRLQVTAAAQPSDHGSPPPLSMLSGAGFLGGATPASNFVLLSPQQGAALVAVTEEMLRFPYHTRYELIELAVYSLAARTQGLASLHAACVGQKGRGLLLMGSSGAGKSTVALQCLLRGMEFVSEDSVLAAPTTLVASGVPSFLHVGQDSLRWVEDARVAARIRGSTVIQRRSGARKFALDVRKGGHRLAASHRLAALIFLSDRRASGRSLLVPLSRAETRARLIAQQPYAASQPQWPALVRAALRLESFELRRGEHPAQAADVLQTLL